MTEIDTASGSPDKDLLDGVGWVLWAGTIGMESPIPARVEAARAGGFSRVSISPLDVAQAADEGTPPEELGRSLRDAGLEIVMDPVMGWHGDAALPGRFSRLGPDDIVNMGEALPVVAMSAIGPFTVDEGALAEIGRSFAGLCDRCAAFGAQVALEFMPISGITDLAMAWTVVDAAGRDNGGILFDTWHFFRGNPDYAALDRVPGDRIFGVQIADAAAEVQGSLAEDTFNRRLPGDGELDLAGIVGALDRMGALRWVGPEVISPLTASMPPAEAGRVSGARVRELVASVRSQRHVEGS